MPASEFDTNDQLQQKAYRGDHDAFDLLDRRQKIDQARREDRAGAAGGASDPFDLGCLALVLVPALLVYLLVTALVTGASAVANDSLLAPLFPRPGDSVARYAVAVVTLEALLPGGLLLAARWVRGRRLHVLRRAVLIPLAIVLVPAILVVTTATTTADVVRVPS